MVGTNDRGKGKLRDKQGQAKMAPVRFVSLDDFRARRLNPGESLPVFLHELKQLSKKAMPDAETATRNQLLLHQFIRKWAPSLYW